MVDILIRDVDEKAAAALKAKAKAAGRQLNDIAREALGQYAKPSKAEAWAAVDAIREKIGKVSESSTTDIREDRDRR